MSWMNCLEIEQGIGCTCELRFSVGYVMYRDTAVQVSGNGRDTG